MNTRERILTNLGALSGRYQTAARVLDVIKDPDSHAKHIAEAVGTDPVLTARVMRMANSEFYGMSGRVMRLDIAVALLGRTAIQGVAAMTITEGAHTEGHFHSVATAVAASTIAPRCFVDPGVAFVTGLVHDLGSALLKFSDPEGYGQLQTVPTEDRCAAEMARWGVDHQQLGAEALARWGFPIDIVAAVAQHHQVDCLCPLARVLKAADSMAEALHVPPERVAYDQLLPLDVMNPEDAMLAMSTLRAHLVKLAL